MVRLEGVRMMEREAEAERKRLEQASPQDKPQEQPAGQVSLQRGLVHITAIKRDGRV